MNVVFPPSIATCWSSLLGDHHVQTISPPPPTEISRSSWEKEVVMNIVAFVVVILMVSMTFTQMGQYGIYMYSTENNSKLRNLCSALQILPRQADIVVPCLIQSRKLKIK